MPSHLAKTKGRRAEGFAADDMRVTPLATTQSDGAVPSVDPGILHSPIASNNGACSEMCLGVESSASTCAAIQGLHREREVAKRLRIKISNGLVSTIATELGYYAGLPEEARKPYRKRAEKLIAAVAKGKEVAEEDRAVAARWTALILQTQKGLAPFIVYEVDLAKRLYALAAQLPVAKWIDSVRGCDYVQLAMIVGETGDLSKHSGPAKVWKRLGLMPFQGRMPKQWAIKGGLTKEQWSIIGYNPRRRAIMHVCSKSLMMQNDGLFRDRYDQAKALFKATHPDCRPCHADQHALLLCVKLFVKHLWCQWNGKPVFDECAK